MKKIVENALSKGYTANDVQVLVPMYRGECGIDAINEMLQAIFNPPDDSNKREMVFGQRIFRIGDKVLQLSNQPETGVMNGDVGEVIGISYKNENEEKEDRLIACFDSKEVSYKKGDLQNLTHAYCVSVHKSQGSEYPIVILPMTHAYHVMLQKKLIYTAITRAKKSLIIIGEYLALDKGVKNEGDERQTTLKCKRNSHQLLIHLKIILRNMEFHLNIWMRWNLKESRPMILWTSRINFFLNINIKKIK